MLQSHRMLDVITKTFELMIILDLKMGSILVVIYFRMVFSNL